LSYSGLKLSNNRYSEKKNYQTVRASVNQRAFLDSITRAAFAWTGSRHPGYAFGWRTRETHAARQAYTITQLNSMQPHPHKEEIA
jgi:hypothetical protein